MPCYKLVAKFQRNDMLARFLRSGRSGFYFSVEQEGIVEAGNSFEFVSHEPEGNHDRRDEPPVRHDRYNRDLLEKAIATPALPEDWRDYLAQRMPAAATQL